jgi:TIR domain
VPEDVIKIFYSYSRKDLNMRNMLEDHLSALREAGKISTWHDLELEAGREWEPAILNKLDTADIILLLVSSNFIASKYCYGKELGRAIARHNEGTAWVIPIILRPCDWNHLDVPFSKLN